LPPPVFFGVKAPERRAAVKAVLDDFASSATPTSVVQLVDVLWQYPEREMQYTAMDVVKKTERLWTQACGREGEEAATAVRECLVRCCRDRPWWDTIDYLSSQGWGPLARAHPEVTGDILRLWVDSEHVWERRVAILFQLHFKDATDGALLFATIRRRAGDEEFWIRKAIGWALRTYRRVNPESVDTFLAQESHMLSNLSLAEARK
jgi:3-methyladenine DNA glycosylase AlkD